MSKSSKKREEVQKVELIPNEEFACPVCGRLSVDVRGCAEHKSEE